LERPALYQVDEAAKFWIPRVVRWEKARIRTVVYLFKSPCFSDAIVVLVFIIFRELLRHLSF
jgi:hypothetical protein